MEDRIEAIKTRLAAATPGPWVAVVRDDDDQWYVRQSDGEHDIVARIGANNFHGVLADARFIAAAPVDLEWLLRVAEAARRTVGPPQGWGRMPAEIIDLIDVLNENSPQRKAVNDAG